MLEKDPVLRRDEGEMGLGRCLPRHTTGDSTPQEALCELRVKKRLALPAHPPAVGQPTNHSSILVHPFLIVREPGRQIGGVVGRIRCPLIGFAWP